MRALFLPLTLGLVFTPALVACGDDDPGTTPDAKTADAPKTPDAPDGPTFGGFNADEGGEVRIEYVRFANSNAAIRATSFLFEDAGSTDYFPFVNQNGCSYVGDHMVWPLAQNPIEERKYLDVGDIIVSGGPQTFTLKKTASEGPDPFFRRHPANEWYFHFLGNMQNDGVTYLSEKKSYDVAFTGSDKVPAQIFDDVGYMPADFALENPPFQATTTVTRGQDATFTWATPPNEEPPDTEIQSLVGFTGSMGPVVVCIEPNDGSITVPSALIEKVYEHYPNGGTLARQTLTHRVRELVTNDGPSGRRIDFLTIWCYAMPWAPPAMP